MNNILFAGKLSSLPDNLNRAYLFLVPKSGELECEQSDQRFMAKSGEILLVPPTAFKLIRGEDVEVLAIDKPLFAFRGVTVFADDELGSFVSLMNMAKRYFNSPSLLLSLGESVVNLTIVLCNVGGGSPVVQAVKSDIENNLSNPLYSVESETLARLPLHPNYVRRIFKAETGISPNGYLEKRRMELAASLLSGNFTNKYSLYSISQIAELCGYADTLYFSKVFKKHFSTSPSKYRER